MSNIVIVGFAEATITRDFYNLMSLTHQVIVLHPNDLLTGQYPLNGKFLVSVTRDKELRQKLIAYLDKFNLDRATFVHPSAVVDPDSVIGGGTFVGPFASVFNNANVSKDCIIGPYSMVSHKSTIGQGSIIHPGSMIAGTTNIGRYCLLGMRCTVLDHLEINDDVVIGAGSMITKTITEPGTYVGSPARKVK
jgi:sugar O-acyltransferase (sialic acid O-acetyltransferase NeuD family)